MFRKKPVFWNEDYKTFAKSFTDKQFSQNRILADKLAISIDIQYIKRNGNICLLMDDKDAKQWLYSNLLQANSCYVIPDLHGTIYQDTHAYLQSEGYAIHILDLENPAECLPYNPLQCMLPKDDAYISAVDKMLGAMTLQDKTQDAFQHEIVKTLIQTVLHHVKTLPAEQQTLKTMQGLLPQEPENGNKHWDGGELRHSTNPTALKGLEILSQAPMSFLMAAAMKVDVMLQEIMATAQKHVAFDMQTLATGKHVIYLKYSHPAWHQNIMSLFCAQLIDVLNTVAEQTDEHELEENWLFYIDHPQYNLAIHLLTAPRHNINLAVHTQAIERLQYIYPHEWDLIVNNCDVMLYAQSASHDTMDWVSKTITQRMERMYPAGKIKREAMPNVNTCLQTMKPEQCVMYMRGCLPFLCTKYKYQQHPKAKNLAN